MITLFSIMIEDTKDLGVQIDKLVRKGRLTEDDSKAIDLISMAQAIELKVTGNSIALSFQYLCCHMDENHDLDDPDFMPVLKVSVSAPGQMRKALLAAFEDFFLSHALEDGYICGPMYGAHRRLLLPIQNEWECRLPFDLDEERNRAMGGEWAYFWELFKTGIAKDSRSESAKDLDFGLIDEDYNDVIILI